jgi:hypothetical protein
VVIGIRHPKVILAIFNTQAVLESDINALTIDIAKTE